MSLTWEPVGYENFEFSSNQGSVVTTYKHLVSVFGPPHCEGDDKTTVEWRVKFSDGVLASIYDWKAYKTPKGLFNWSIGGYDKKASENVKMVLGPVQTTEDSETSEQNATEAKNDPSLTKLNRIESLMDELERSRITMTRSSLFAEIRGIIRGSI